MESIEGNQEDMVVAFRLAPTDHDAFRRACRAEQRSMSGQLRVLVRDWLRSQEPDTDSADPIAA